MFLHVDDVQHLDNYRLRLKFNNNAIRVVDLTTELYGKIFEGFVEIQFLSKFQFCPKAVSLCCIDKIVSTAGCT